MLQNAASDSTPVYYLLSKKKQQKKTADTDQMPFFVRSMDLHHLIKLVCSSTCENYVICGVPEKLSCLFYSNGMTPGAASIGSASSLAYRLRSRESAASLNRSITSTDSCRSNASVPSKYMYACMNLTKSAPDKRGVHVNIYPHILVMGIL